MVRSEFQARVRLRRRVSPGLCGWIEPDGESAVFCLTGASRAKLVRFDRQPRWCYNGLRGNCRLASLTGPGPSKRWRGSVGQGSGLALDLSMGTGYNGSGRRGRAFCFWQRGANIRPSGYPCSETQYPSRRAGHPAPVVFPPLATSVIYQEIEVVSCGRRQCGGLRWG